MKYQNLKKKKSHKLCIGFADHAGHPLGSLTFSSSCGLHYLCMKLHVHVCFEELLVKQQNMSKDSVGDDMLNCFHMFPFKLPKPLTCSLSDVVCVSY